MALADEVLVFFFFFQHTTCCLHRTLTLYSPINHAVKYLSDSTEMPFSHLCLSQRYAQTSSPHRWIQIGNMSMTVQQQH